MSDDQRECWLPWSDDLGEYLGTVSSCRDFSQIECDDINSDGRFGVNDYHPVLIPPPSEIAANARDAERWRRFLELRSTYKSFRVVEDLIISSLGVVSIDAAMKGGK